MRERPILMAGDMVRAIRDGRKTQTRRLIRPQPQPFQEAKSWDLKIKGHTFGWHASVKNPKIITPFCPYAQIGDRLWVRETWGLDGVFADIDSAGIKEYEYPAEAMKEHLKYRADRDGYDEAVQMWRPSMHMPRWACRLFLDVTNIRAERIQDVSEADAIAEGISVSIAPPRAAYEMLWNRMNGLPFTWVKNPWVWVIDFEVLK